METDQTVPVVCRRRSSAQTVQVRASFHHAILLKILAKVRQNYLDCQFFLDNCQRTKRP